MKSRIILRNIAFLVGFPAVLSCSDAGNQSATNNGSAQQDSIPKDLSQGNQADPAQDKEFVNPIEYAKDVDTLRTWALLCEYSKWGEDLRGGNYTLLCPRINLLKTKGKDLLVALKDKKNQDILNALVAAHILKTDVSVTKWKYDDIIETIDGRKYKVGGQVIQDMVYFTYELPTQHGYVVLTEGILDFPEKELRARMTAK